MLQNLVNAFQPPAWVVDEIQNRVVLLVNHVLSQEPEAQDRVRRQQGKTTRLVWGQFDLALTATPAGLLERPLGAGSRTSAAVDLTVTLTQGAVSDVLQTLLRGDKPTVNIEGDVQLAAEVAWLADNLRWDMEEDLARWLGDVPAATLARTFRLSADAVKAFASRWLPAQAAGATRASAA